MCILVSRNHSRALACVVFFLLEIATASAQSTATKKTTPDNALLQYAKIPLYFEENVGQADAQVRFLSRGRGYGLFLTPTEAVLALRTNEPASNDLRHFVAQRATGRPPAIKRSVIRLSFQGTRAKSMVVGLDELEGKANYLIGNDQTKWHTNVPLFSEVQYSQLYEGINVVYYGSQGRLEYDLLLAPNTDPGVIRFRTEGADSVKLTKSGDLQLQTNAGTVVLRKPKMYQVDQQGRKQVKGGYILRHNNEIGIAIADYDRTKQLVVDPVLEYSTYLGGTGQEYEYGNGVGVDSQGNLYLEGVTTSSDFPPSTTIGTTKGNGSDILFVTKINPTGTSLVYSTYIGGTGNNIPYYNGPDEPLSIAVDANGYAYVTGVTVAPDFPVTSTAFQTTLAAGVSVEAFLSKLSADGQSLLYSTYLGGNNENWAQGIGVDANQNAYLTGWSTASSPAFPLTPGAFQTVNRSLYGDAFVSKIDTTKSGAGSLVYSTLIGGSSNSTIGDMGIAVAADSSGKIYVTGLASSTDFPVMATAFQSTGGNPPYGNVFLSEFDPTQSGVASLLYSTYLGGTGQGADIANALAMDQAGRVHIGGGTSSSGFPTTISSAGDAFIAEFDTTKANAASLIYSRCFGSASVSAAVNSMAVDPSGNTYVGGYTMDNGFPLTADAVQSANKAYPGASGFLSFFSTDASTILYSTYFGSSNLSIVKGVALDPANNIYITGFAEGIDLPTTQQLFQPTLQGTSDLFIAKFGGISTPTITNLSATSGLTGSLLTITGLNFGSSPGTVTFNGVAATPASWNANSIVVPVPAGSTTGNVVVKAGGTASNGMPFTVLSGSTPIVLVQHARKAAGTTTSAPLAFASNNSAGNWIGVCVRASGISQTLSVSDSNGNFYRQALSVNETGGGNTLAIFYAENVAAGPNIVTVSDAASSNLDLTILEYSGVALFSSLDTTISAIGDSSSPNTGTATTTANGDLLLAAFMSANAATFTAGSGYTEEEFVPAEPATELISEDQILSQAGSEAASATLGATGFWAAALAAFKTADIGAGTGPTITTLNPATGTNGTVVTIDGYNFGASQGAVKFNGTSATPISWSPTAITVADPAGATDGQVVVIVNGVASNGVWFPQPNITTTSPGNGAVGATVTINGAHFGTAKGAVRFNGIAGSPSSWVANKIVVPVPNGATSGPIVVANSNGIVSNEVTFTVNGLVPTVSSLSPATGAVGTAVTITGTNFGTAQGSSSTVTFDGVLAGTAIQWGSGAIKIAVPSGATTGNVVVTVGGQSDVQTKIFTVPGTASVSGISPSRGGVGAAVSIAGSNLGSAGTVKFNGVRAVPWSWSPTLVVVPVPSGATSGPVAVTVGGTQLSAGVFSVRSPIPSTATEFSYDPMGRVIQKTVCTPMNCGTEEAPLNLSVTYDFAGDETSVSFYGPTITYTLDGAAHVTLVTSSWNDSQHPATLVTMNATNGYWPTGAMREGTLGNGLTLSTVYNDRLQPCRISVNSSGTLLNTCADAVPAGNIQDFTGGFNLGTGDNGNVATFTAVGQQNFNRAYAYDSLNRISAMSALGDQCSGLSWSIDAWGNRKAQTPTGGTCFSPSVSVNTANQLTGAPYQYDAAGDLLNDGNHQYAYDAEGRVTSVDGGATASYTYDAFGNRVQKTVGGADSEYVYDQASRLNTVFNNGAFGRGFVYVNGQPLAEYYDNTTYFVHTDYLGSTRLLTELNQSVAESDDYYPYGELVPPSGGTSDSLKFTGKERDSESGLDYFGARHYASTIGRFMVPDKPFDDHAPTDPQSWNLYSYVRNNPLSFTDPNGGACVQGVDGNYHDDNGAGETCAQVDVNNATTGPSVTVSATTDDVSYQLAHNVANLTSTSSLSEVGVNGMLWAGSARATWDLGALGLSWAMGRASGEMIQGLYGPVSRAALEAAASGGGPTVRVVCTLDAAPAAGRALSTATGAGADALANAAGGGAKYVANIPSALVQTMENAGLVTRSTTSMGGAVATELQFSPQATQFVVQFFHAVH
jgi:RHS repeat-associated protein